MGRSGNNKEMDALNVAIKQSLLFRDVDRSVFFDHLCACPRYWVKDREPLLFPGQDNKKVYFLIRGRLSIHLEKPESPPIRIVYPGETVGELSMIASSKTSAYVLSINQSEVVAIDHDLLWTFMDQATVIAKNLLLIFSGWIVSNNHIATHQLKTLENLQGLACTDGLTGIHNRRAFDETSLRHLDRALRTGHPLTLVIMDVDHFKRYNDTYGHQAGDHALMALASIIKLFIRPADFAARYGGEEFVVLLPETPADIALKVAERLRLAVMEGKILSNQGDPLPGITISLGLATSRAGVTLASMLEEADQNLYRAKAGGRNQCCQKPLIPL